MLANPAWKALWANLSDYVERSAQACDVAHDPDKALDIIRCKQVLRSIEREAHRLVQDGQIAEIDAANIQALERPPRKMRR